MKKVVTYLLIFYLAGVSLFATLAIPETVYDKKDMKEINLGYPIHFIIQDVTKYDPPFPGKYGFESPWENPTDIS